MRINIIETARVTPFVDSDSIFKSQNSLTIPLTFFDLSWLLFHPNKLVSFYKLTNSTHEHFHSSILPKLKLSLSLTLVNYLPFSGCIIWNPTEPKPSIVVSQNDAISVTIAETDADYFSHLSSYGQRPVSELHALIPKLSVADDSATVLSLQITLFPKQGFSIGMAAHHAVIDGISSSMFIKAWAHICKNQLENIPKNLTPSYDRSLINDMVELDAKMVEMVRSLKRDKTNIRSLTPFPARELGEDVVLATLVLSRDDIERLRERVKNNVNSPSLLHLSTFVIAYAYTWTCFVKARGGNGERSVSLLFSGNVRERLDPKLPATYFGNCVIPLGCYDRKAAEFTEDIKGFVTAVEILSDLVKGLSLRKVDTVVESFAETFHFQSGSTQFGTVAGSTQLGVYESDFGWGRSVKADIISIDQSEAISMTERRDDSGGIEIGMCLKKSEMDLVLSFFNNGLQN